MRLNLTQHGKSYQYQTLKWLTVVPLLFDSLDGGAWPFWVDGLLCLVNSANERDPFLIRWVQCESFLTYSGWYLHWYVGRLGLKQVCDALRCSGQHVCYIDGDNSVSTYGSVLFKCVSLRGWIVVVFVLNYNVECLVSVNQQFVLNMSLFFVHTARRSFRFYRLI